MTESIGGQLRLAREARNLTIDQVSEATRIRPYYIQALEKDDYSAVPSAAQARGFLRIYAAYLGLNVDELLSKTRPVEPVPDASSSASPSPEVPAAAGQAVSAQVEKRRSGFLAGLRERFARPLAVQPPAASVAPVVTKAQPESLPEPVVSQADKEESPNQPAKPLPEQPTAEKVSIEKDKTLTRKTAAAKSAKSRQVSKDRETATSAKPSRRVVRLKKSSDDVIPAEAVDEKKKMTE